ncbi:MAG: HAD family hydrolase [Chthoniobacterales bacterium]
MAKYRAVLFDLFGTIALIDPEKLPLFEWAGTTTRSTTAALKRLYEDANTGIPFAEFVNALDTVLREQWQRREHHLREVACVTRFTRTLVRAGLTDSLSASTLAEKLSREHNAALIRATEISREHANFIERAARKYQLGLVSNFDDASTAYALLRAAGIERHFQCVTISVEQGWRKPDVRIFRDTLAGLGVEASEALFVGDAAVEDVAGAKRAGMDVAWINPSGLAVPPAIPRPDFNMPSLLALERVLLE